MDPSEAAGRRWYACSLPARYAKDIETRTREEDATIDAEDILTQAEEANALDPVE